MVKNLRYDEVGVGTVIPSVQKGPIKMRDLVKWAGAAADYNEIHYDELLAREQWGMPGPIVHGPLKAALIVRMLVNWMGPDGSLRRLTTQYRRPDLTGHMLICRGKVSGKQVVDGEHRVECDVWVEDENGEISTKGSALVVLPAAE